MIAWGGNCSKKQTCKIDSVIKRSSKIINGEQLLSFQSVYFDLCHKKLISIMKDETYPLYKSINFSKIRVNRLIHVKSRTSRFLNSFFPTAVRNF